MKKFLVAACLLLVASASYAVFPVNLGIKAGYTTSELETKFSKSNMSNFMIGAWGRVNIGDHWHVQPEVYYTKKGDSKADFDFQSYNVPVLLGYRLIAKGPVKLRINAGPVFSFVGKMSDALESVNNIKNSYTAVQFGAGIDFLMLSLDLSMERGGNMSEIKDFDANPALFMVTVGWKFI